MLLCTTPSGPVLIDIAAECAVATWEERTKVHQHTEMVPSLHGQGIHCNICIASDPGFLSQIFSHRFGEKFSSKL